MDSSLYKTVTTKRGLKYAYASIPAEGTPRDTILFVHGFPSSSYDWRKQVDFFRKAGFSLIIPDTLGAGETEKPADWTLFQFRAMAGDVIDILDAEKVEKVIVIGHDWYVSPSVSGFYLDADLRARLWNVCRGSILTSRLASYYPERFKAFAFVAVGYSPTSEGFDYEVAATKIKEAIGYETYGYWE